MSRFRRPKWRDPRLAVGVLLIVASVALGAWIFAEADKTYPIYIATDSIPVGTPVTDAALEVSHVQLDSAKDLYLGPQELADTDLAEPVFMEATPAGELIPISRLGDATELHLRPLSVSVAQPGQVEVGDVVDMWMKEEDVTGRQGAPPELIAEELHVTGIDTDESIFAATNGRVVHILVPEGDVEAVLAAVGSKSLITLIPQLHG